MRTKLIPSVLALLISLSTAVSAKELSLQKAIKQKLVEVLLLPQEGDPTTGNVEFFKKDTKTRSILSEAIPQSTVRYDINLEIDEEKDSKKDPLEITPGTITFNCTTKTTKLFRRVAELEGAESFDPEDFTMVVTVAEDNAISIDAPIDIIINLQESAFIKPKRFLAIYKVECQANDNKKLSINSKSNFAIKRKD